MRRKELEWTETARRDKHITGVGAGRTHTRARTRTLPRSWLCLFLTHSRCCGERVGDWMQSNVTHPFMLSRRRRLATGGSDSSTASTAAPPASTTSPMVPHEPSHTSHETTHHCLAHSEISGRGSCTFRVSTILRCWTRVRTAVLYIDIIVYDYHVRPLRFAHANAQPGPQDLIVLALRTKNQECSLTEYNKPSSKFGYQEQ